MLVPEELGGGSVSGSGVVDLTLVADAFGHGVAPGPLLPCNVVAAALARAGSDEHRGELLPSLVAGETRRGMGRRPACRPRDPRRRHVPSPTATASCSRARRRPVEAAAQADVLLVTAALADGGLVQFVVAPDAPGVTDHARSTASTSRAGTPRVELDGAHVDAAGRGRHAGRGRRPTSSASSSSRW